MHSIKGRWTGQAFAVAASNDSGGRKSRIRRSKEERKEMVESFIKKYQKSNDGNFPSLNLTHKEVGGSFYTVREIVREIIQENRVLAPPKVSSEEHDHSEFLEQHPLGSISVEPQIDLSISDGTNMAAHVMPNEYQITSEETFSSSSVQFNGSYPPELKNEEITNRVIKVADRDEVSDKTSKTYHATNRCEDTTMKEVSNCIEQLPQPKSHELENEKIVTSVNGPAGQWLSNEHVMPNEYQITSEETFSSSSVQFNGSYPPELENQEITNGVIKVADRDEVSDKTIKSYHATNRYEDTSMKEVSEQLPQPKSHELENEKIVTSVDGPASQRLCNEQYHNKNDHMVDKTKEFGERVYIDARIMEILDREKHEARDVEASQAIKPYMNSDVVVETFPLRPVTRSIYEVDGESGKLHEADGTLEDKAIQPDKRTSTQSSSDLVNEQNKEKLPESTMGLNGENRDDNVVLNLQSPSLESSKSLSASQPSVLDIVDNADLESKDFLPDGTKASNSTELLTSKDSTAVGKKSIDQDISTLPTGNNPEKINPETSEGASENSTQSDSNPLLALVKAFISSFVKFWTD